MSVCGCVADYLRVSNQVWLIGKFQPVVNKHVPLGGDAVVFSVPDPMDHAKRPDLHITEGACTHSNT